MALVLEKWDYGWFPSHILLTFQECSHNTMLTEAFPVVSKVWLKAPLSARSSMSCQTQPSPVFITSSPCTCRLFEKNWDMERTFITLESSLFSVGFVPGESNVLFPFRWGRGMGSSWSLTCQVEEALGEQSERPHRDLCWAAAILGLPALAWGCNQTGAPGSTGRLTCVPQVWDEWD